MTLTCPRCGNTEVVKLATQFVFICTDCKTETPWPLREGQRRLVNTSRGDRKK